MSYVWEIFAKVCVCVITKIAAEVTLSLRIGDPGQDRVGVGGSLILGQSFFRALNSLPFPYCLYIFSLLVNRG